MKLTFKKHEVKDLQQLRTLVTEHADAIEPGCRIISAGVNLGRSTVDLAGLDARRTPVLVTLGFTADDEMLFRMLEAYAWCLEYPESVRRIVGEGQGEWPPRVVFVAQRLLEAFLRKIRLLKFPAVDCFEFRCVEVNGATGFYLDPVDWGRSHTASARDADAPAPRRVTLPREEPEPAGEPVSEPPAAPPLPKRPAVADQREEPHRAARREPAAAPVSRQNGADDPRETPRWLELLATPAELVGLKSAPGSEVPPEGTPSGAAADGSEPGEVPEELSSKQRAILEGLGLTPSRELAPTWRKFLERLTNGFDALATPNTEEGAPAPAPAHDPEPVVQAPPVRAAAAPAPAPPAPAPAAKNGTAPVHASGEKRALPDGVQLPSNGELAPQWRKFLDRPSIDESKIAAVKEFLHREFPLYTIYDFYEFQRNAHVFQLQDNHGKVVQLATLTVDFFEGQRDSEIRPWLEKHKLAQAMRQAGPVGVLVSQSGLTIEKR
jgi:hypothetical protein